MKVNGKVFFVHVMNIMVSVYDLIEECDKMVDSTQQKTIGM